MFGIIFINRTTVRKDAYLPGHFLEYDPCVFMLVETRNRKP